MGEVTPLLIDAFIWLAFIALWLIASCFVHKTKSRESWLSRANHVVPLYLGFYLMFAKRHVGPLDYRLYSNNVASWTGALLTGAGVLFAIWARATIGRYWSGFVTLKQNHKLIRTGPYAIARHPIYTGMIVGAFGTALSAARIDAMFGFTIITLSLLFKSRREEKLLATEFGEDYIEFKREVPALFPLLGWLSPDANQPIKSPAFQEAVLRSDRYRMFAMLSICGAWMLFDLAEALANPQLARRYSVFLCYWSVLAVYEIALLILTIRSQRKGKPIRPWIWAVNTTFECLLPSFAMLGLTADKSYVGPYRALVSASVPIYFLFIILSTLRLSPMLCIIAGAVCSAGYSSVYWITLQLAPNNDYRYFMPERTFVLYPIMLASAGLIAASVAHRIRRHVIAALAEADTRLALDRVEYDLNVARSIQTGLLPKFPPQVDSYDIAGWSLPAQQTGGDYYDWLQLPDGKILFTIADVTGHGIGPALLAASCRASFRAIVPQQSSPERIMHQVDAQIAADIPAGRFITAALALLDPSTHQLSLYSAGHAPLYLYSAAADRVDSLEADQPPLGASFYDEDSPPQARILPLAPGDALILVTDGFFECANPTGQMLGIAVLAEIIRDAKENSSEQLIATMHQQVVKFSQGQPQGDDLTAVVIKRRTEPPATYSQ